MSTDTRDSKSEKQTVATALAGDATALTTIPDGGFHGDDDSDETTA
jgi:hypothetical protein